MIFVGKRGPLGGALLSSDRNGRSCLWSLSGKDERSSSMPAGGEKEIK